MPPERSEAYRDLPSPLGTLRLYYTDQNHYYITTVESVVFHRKGLPPRDIPGFRFGMYFDSKGDKLRYSYDWVRNDALSHIEIYSHHYKYFRDIARSIVQSYILSGDVSALHREGVLVQYYNMVVDKINRVNSLEQDLALAKSILIQAKVEYHRATGTVWPEEE